LKLVRKRQIDDERGVGLARDEERTMLWPTFARSRFVELDRLRLSRRLSRTE
jgi:hypothetical protein